MFPRVMWSIGIAGFVIMTIGFVFVYLADPTREVALNIGPVIFNEEALRAGKIMFYSGAVGMAAFALPWWR